MWILDSRDTRLPYPLTSLHQAGAATQPVDPRPIECMKTKESVKAQTAGKHEDKLKHNGGINTVEARG